ncbi:MAG TPA: single-stranded DNA-binding protein [Acidimicrobiales bacterium]|nr:single-stranded DNA-binding protein [Acidimicrobiales bacterium]
MCAWNVVVVAGRLSRPAEQRVLPSGERLVAVQVTVDRTDDRAETVPVVWFDAPASAAGLDVEEAVVVVGRVRRRFFQAGGSTQSRTEVVADVVVPTRRAKSARTALAAATARLEEASGELEQPAPRAGRRSQATDAGASTTPGSRAR